MPTPQRGFLSRAIGLGAWLPLAAGLLLGSLSLYFEDFSLDREVIDAENQFAKLRSQNAQGRIAEPVAEARDDPVAAGRASELEREKVESLVAGVGTETGVEVLRLVHAKQRDSGAIRYAAQARGDYASLFDFLDGLGSLSPVSRFTRVKLEREDGQFRASVVFEVSAS